MRFLRFATLCTLITLLTAAPASAHEEINPKTVTVGQPTFFTLSAANEQKDPLTKLVIAAPAALTFGSSTRSPAGWQADRTDTTITWTGGSVAPDTFEQWGFEIEGADQPGTLTFKVTLTAGTANDDVTVAVTATAPGTPATPGTQTQPAVTTTTPATTATTAPATGTSTAAADGRLASSVKQAKDKAGTANLLGIIALILAAVAVLLALLRRRSSSAATSSEEQDF